jgi:polysaccharide biosynthesis/export protein
MTDMVAAKRPESPTAMLNNLRHERPAAKATAPARRANTALSITRVLTGALILFCAPALPRAQQPPSGNADSVQHRPALKTPTNALSRDVEYLIYPEDRLDIYILNIPELSREYRVDSNGSLALPLLADPIPAAGLTLGGLSRIIGDRLRQAGMVTNAEVIVQVKESGAHSITVTGAVKRPDVYPIFSKTTLMDALSQAEGLAVDAGNIAIITRGGMAVSRLESGPEVAEPGPGGLGPNLAPTVTVDLNRLFEAGDSNLNLDLYPGDRVTVRRAGIVYVVGAVKKAGGFALKDDQEQMTVLKAVALAENITPTAAPKKAMIVRKNAGGTEEVPVDLAKLLSGHAADCPLQSSDILFVPDSSSKKVLQRVGEAAAQAASLLVYRIP